jgi:precorrin isomerase
MSLVWLALALAVSGPAHAAPVQSEAEARAECSGDPRGQWGMNACLEKKASDSAIALRKAETAMFAALTTWGEWPRFVAAAQQGFVRSNRMRSCTAPA